MPTPINATATNPPAAVRQSAPPGIPPPPTATTERKKVAFGEIPSSAGHRIVLYGTGGIGKTTLAAQLPGPVAFIDLDESLPRLKPQLEAAGIMPNILPVTGVDSWASLREVLQSDGWGSVKTIVIDTATKAEEFALQWMFANIKEKGNTASRLEDYGYKAGYRHLFDTFSLLFSDLDHHARAGRNICLICHDCQAKVPNPQGQDWIRNEPRLTQNDNCQLRPRIKEWADHVLFIGYDVATSENSKVGVGSGTRSLYTYELPHCMAKSRGAQEIIPVGPDGAAIWKTII